VGDAAQAVNPKPSVGSLPTLGFLLEEIMRRFHWQNHNEFKSKMRWHDYFALVIHEFSIVLVRRYDWMEKPDDESRTFIIQILGWTIYQRIWGWFPDEEK
jgi:hypothetical protein